MQINSTYANAYQPAYAQQGALESKVTSEDDNGASPELRKAFDQFVGQTFFSQLLSQMRKTVDKPAYFHGGRGEEMFQGQLDQMLSERMTEASADTFSGPMFDLFMLGRA